MNWKLVDELFASFSRPFGIYVCSGAIAFATVWAAIYGNDGALIATLTAASAIAGGSAVLRSIDKNTNAKAATEDKRIAADAIVVGKKLDVVTDVTDRTAEAIMGPKSPPQAGEAKP